MTDAEILKELQEDTLLAIDAGHAMLKSSDGDIFGALGIYTVTCLNVADTLASSDEDFEKGMAEAYVRMVVGLTGLIMAYRDNNPVNVDDDD